MAKKIVFLNTGHYSLDERVFYHQAKSLVSFDYEILIISTKEIRIDFIDSIHIKSYNDEMLSNKEKIAKIVAALNEFLPEIIVCDTPTAVIAASVFREKSNSKIIYDITEWYPSKKNFRNEHGIKKYIKFIILVLFNIFAGLKSTSFIFGEYYKSLPFRLLFFWKSYIFLPYYPDLKYIKQIPFNSIEKEINLLYSGIINTDKGIDAVFNAVDLVSRKKPTVLINLEIIGFFPTYEDQQHFKKICNSLAPNVRIIRQDKLAYQDFCNAIGKADLFLDLRKKDIENTLCLPIKLFYYLACGRPVIYSDLRSIKHEIQNFNFGYLCKPNDCNTIATHIVHYIENPDIYLQHATNALEVSKKVYNWKIIEKKFILFIEKHRTL